MDQPGAPDPLKDLGARIDKAFDSRSSPSRKADGGSGGSNDALAMGMRIGLELVVGVVVGVGVGYLIDRAFGTRPWGMVACFFLGAAAGMVNVYRTIAGLGMAAGYRRGQTSKPVPDDDWDED